MRRPGRGAAALAAPLITGSLLVPLAPSVAAAPPPSRTAPTRSAPGAPSAASPHGAWLGAVQEQPQPGQPVGGPQLGGTGVIVNGGAGVPAAPKVDADSWLIANADTGEVLAARNPHGRFLPASTIKTLTALALVKKLDPDRKVRPTQATVNVEGTKVGMSPKMEYKVSDLFYAMLMMSANDASLGLAQANGGLKKTLDDMNAEAKRISALDTRAGSPNGLDTDLGLDVKTQHTSAYDLALILREGLKNPDFRKYTETIDHRFPAPPTKKERKAGKKIGGYPIHTHNRMLPGQSQEYKGMIGGKNGYTVAARQTFVAAARRDGHTIVISLMKADQAPSVLAKDLLDWGFAARGKARPIGALVSPVPPRNGTRKKAIGNNALLPTNPITKDDSAGGWGLLAAGGAGVALVVGWGGLRAIRRRRVASEFRRGMEKPINTESPR
jgi:D-alanyl-D-alanine carboxypeptidase